MKQKVEDVRAVPASAAVDQVDLEMLTVLVEAQLDDVVGGGYSRNGTFFASGHSKA